MNNFKISNPIKKVENAVHEWAKEDYGICQECTDCGYIGTESVESDAYIDTENGCSAIYCPKCYSYNLYIKEE
jgi:hypothetical protein